MNLSDRVKQVFGLEDEPNCSVCLNLNSGDLEIICTFESICNSIRRTVLNQLIDMGVQLNIPHINISCDNKLVYRFPPASALAYRNYREKHEPRG